MKRISALVCVIMMVAMAMAPGCFAVNSDDTAAADKAGFQLESSSPEDGAKGVAVDNLSVKLKFNKEMRPETKKARQANEKQFKLTNSEGKRIPIKVYYSEDEEGLLLVAADTYSKKNKDTKIQGDEEYTLTIGKNLKATDGTTLGVIETVSMKTLNQGRSTMIYMILMVLMMVGMVFFVMRGTKKEEQKKQEERSAKDGVNPYKEAKKSGKSVEEIVAKESKKKAKREEAIRRQKEAEEAIEAEILERIRKEANKRVSSPRSIAATGSGLKIKVRKDDGELVENPKESKAKTVKAVSRPKKATKKKNKKK